MTERMFSNMVTRVVAALEDNDHVGAARIFEDAVSRYSLNRIAAQVAVRSHFHQQDADSAAKFMAALSAGISVVRGRAA
jgi:hypothetical protein